MFAGPESVSMLSTSSRRFAQTLCEWWAHGRGSLYNQERVGKGVLAPLGCQSWARPDPERLSSCKFHKIWYTRLSTVLPTNSYWCFKKNWYITDIDLAFFCKQKLSCPNLSSQLWKGICALPVLLPVSRITSNCIHGLGDDGHFNIGDIPSVSSPVGFPSFAKIPPLRWNGAREFHGAALLCCRRTFDLLCFITAWTIF